MGASQATGLGAPEGAEPHSRLVATPAIPSAALSSMIDDLLQPFTGVTRGLLDTDRGSKLIRIRIDECRKIALCLQMARDEFATLASAMSAFGQDNEDWLEAKPASAVPKGDAHVR